MRALLRKHLHGKKVLILLVLTNLLYGFMILITIPKVMQYTQGMKIFDMMPTGYDAEYAKTLLDTLGTAGRNTYLYSQIPADLIYPGLFGISYCILIAYFLKSVCGALWFHFHNDPPNQKDEHRNERQRGCNAFKYGTNIPKSGNQG